MNGFPAVFAVYRDDVSQQSYQLLESIPHAGGTEFTLRNKWEANERLLYTETYKEHFRVVEDPEEAEVRSGSVIVRVQLDLPHYKSRVAWERTGKALLGSSGILIPLLRIDRLNVLPRLWPQAVVSYRSRPTTASPSRLPFFVAEALVEHAIRRQKVCPIIHEPLHSTGVSVTSCFHIFQTEALEEWRAACAAHCPVCQKPYEVVSL